MQARLHRIVADLSDATAAVPPSDGVSLAPREREVLQLVAVGMSNSAAAHALGLGNETVKTYLRSAMRTLAVDNRTAAVHAARLRGLI